MLLCEECEQYPYCTSLCPVALDYVNQDNPLFHPRKGRGKLFTKFEEKILGLIWEGKKREDIRKILNISAVTLRRHLANMRKKGVKTPRM